MQIVTPALVLREVEMHSSAAYPEQGLISVFGQGQPAAEKQAVQRLRPVLLFRVYAI